MGEWKETSDARRTRQIDKTLKNQVKFF